MTVSIPSHIHAVSVYQSGAQVTRVAELAGDSPAEVRIDDLPLCLEDDSVQVRIEGPSPTLEAIGFRVALDVKSAGASNPTVEERALPDAWREEQIARQRLEQAKGSLSRWQQVGVPPRRGTRKGGEPTPPPPSPTAGRLALLDQAHEQIEALSARLLDLEGELNAAQARLREIQARWKQSEGGKASEVRKAAVVALRPRATAPEGAAGGPMRLVIEYRVPGARWAPAYSLDFTPDLSMARLSVRGLVSQRTGEDWRGARVSLSTAQAQRWTELPDLPSLRIGRRQPRPPRAGWREVPDVADALYVDFLLARDRHVPPPPPSIAAKTIASAEPATRVVLAAPPPAPPAVEDFGDVMICAESMEAGADFEEGPALRDSAPARRARASEVGHFFGGKSKSAPAAASAVRPEPPEPAPLRAGANWLDFGSLRMPPPEDPGRGRLARPSRAELYREALDEARADLRADVADLLLHAEMEASRNESGPPPPGCTLPRDVEGFDHVYFVEGEVDVPSDGQYHSVPLASAESHPTTRFVTVPRIGPEVFRVAEVPNPLDAPLLTGPADVRIGPDFLMTVPLRTTPSRGVIQVGLGAEQGIKVARNTTFEEEATGLLGGTLLLRHGISVRVANRLPQPATIEVRERVPVTQDGDKEVRVQGVTAEPPWEPFEQDETGLKGGQRWVVTVPPGREQELRASYSVQIPSKSELSGGNRREE